MAKENAAIRAAGHASGSQSAGQGLYTEAERKRRDDLVWTFVQGVLAPVQFVIFLVSLGLVLRYLTDCAKVHCRQTSPSSPRLLRSTPS